MQSSTKQRIKHRIIGGLVVTAITAIIFSVFLFYHPLPGVKSESATSTVQIPEAPSSANANNPNQVVYELPLQKLKTKKVDDDKPLKDLYDRDDTTSMADLRSKAAKTNAVSAKILRSETAVAVAQAKKKEKEKEAFNLAISKASKEVRPLPAKISKQQAESAKNFESNQDQDVLSNPVKVSQDGNVEHDVVSDVADPREDNAKGAENIQDQDQNELSVRQHDETIPDNDQPSDFNPVREQASISKTHSDEADAPNDGDQEEISNSQNYDLPPPHDKKSESPLRNDEITRIQNQKLEMSSTTRDNAKNQVLSQSNLDSVPQAWVLQIASFSDQNNAMGLVDAIRKMGMDVYTKNLKTNSGTLVQVYVGPYIKFEKVKQLQHQLQQMLHLRGAIKQYIL